MNYTVFMPTLVHRASVKIAVTLWNQEDVRTLLSDFDYDSSEDERRENWEEIKYVVHEKLSQLPDLPEDVKDKVAALIHPIGLQMLRWVEFHTAYEFLAINLPKELCWTAQGTVDDKRTAEMIVKDESVDFTARFKLSCMNSLEKDIVALSKEMSIDHYKSLFDELDRMGSNQIQDLMMIWISDINGTLHEVEKAIEIDNPVKISPYHFAFDVALSDGLKSSAEYYYQKLTPEEKAEALVRLAIQVVEKHSGIEHSTTELFDAYFSDTFCFLLSQMEKEMQIQLFKSNARNSLLCFLDWPLHCFFMDTAQHVWDSLDEEEFEYVLWEIIDKIKDEGKSDDTYKRLFSSFWQQSPASHKTHVINGSAILRILIYMEDKNNVKLLLREMTAIQREQLLFSASGKNICCVLAYDEKWDMIKFFILQCIKAKESMLELKDVYLVSATKISDEYVDVKKEFFELLDELIRTYVEKRSLDDIENAPTKKLCNDV